MRPYIESDGRIFLARHENLWDLPFPDELPFPIHAIAPLPVDGDVWFCVPRLNAHPAHWPSKDDVPGMPDVASRVREAVHATMPRVVVEAICLQGDCVLLVRGSRGLTKGRWSLPGGFLRFGETPEEGVLREMQEEVGMRGEIERWVTASGKLGTHTALHWVMLYFLVKPQGAPYPDPDEIAEARYVPLRDAPGLLADRLMADVVAGIAAEQLPTTEDPY